MSEHFGDNLFILFVGLGLLCVLCLVGAGVEKLSQHLRGSRRPSFFPVKP
jgi:hypothetical protein